MQDVFKKHRLRNRLLFSVGVFVGICLIGVLGYRVLGWKLGDAIYMVVITIFGIGYGEIEPVDTFYERIFTIAFIIGGYTAALYVIGEFVRTITEGEIAKALGDMQKNRRVEGISHHSIICGYGRIGQVLALELARNGSPFVIVDVDKERIAQAQTLGYLVIEGSATEEETLVQAGIQRADVLATVLPQDTLNVFITLTARNINRNIRIIARGEQPSTEKKLRQAGATEVILPSSIGGMRIAHSIMKPSVMDFLGGKDGLASTDFHHLGVEIHELSLKHHSHLEGWSIGEIHRRAEGSVMVLAVRRVGGDIVRDDLDHLVASAGDSLIVMGRPGGTPGFLRQEAADTELI